MHPSDSVYRSIIHRLKNPPADRSFLDETYKDLARWKEGTRTWIDGLLHYRPEKAPLDITVRDEVDFGTYVRRDIEFSSTADCRVPAFLLVPKKRTGRAPAVVALHDHSARFHWGKEKLVDHKKRPAGVDRLQLVRYGDRGFASALAERGCVVAVIDALRFGERGWLRESWLANGVEALDGKTPGTEEYINTYDATWMKNDELMSRTLQFAGVTYMGIMVWDDMRTVDLLCSLPEVDPGRLACMGLSMGGYRSAWLGAMDERVRCVCSVGYILRFSDIVPHNTPASWAVVPGLYDHLPYPDLFGLCAPRDLLVLYGQNDRVFPLSSAEKAVDTIRRCYEKAGAVEKFKSACFPVGHQFDVEMQEYAFGWLERRLGSDARTAV